MKDTNQPNIVLLMSDQHRYDCVGFSGKYPVKTPNLDKLAQNGVWFNNAYCTIPTCCPARQSLISGQRPERFGAHWNFGISLKIPDLSPDNFSFAKSMKESGYQTSYVGRWHVSETATPLEFGFDSYYGEEHYDQWMRALGYQNPWAVVEEHGVESMLGWKSEIPYERAAPHVLADKAIKKINELSANKEQPFLVVLALAEPHLPCTPSEPFASMFEPSDVEKWGGFDDLFEDKPYIQKQMTRNWMLEDHDWEAWSACVARYYASIAQMDDAMGNVIRHLEETGLTNDTVIIYTADHGDMCGSHRMLDKHYIMYDDVVHVPLIVRWDGHFPVRRTNEFVHNFLDLHETILELAGAVSQEDSDGESLMLQLMGTDLGRDYAISTYNGQQFGLYNQRMIRTENYKYIWNLTDVDELYDMKKDPYELHNMIHKKEYADILKELRISLYHALEKCGDRLLNSTGAKVQLLNGNKL